MIQSAGFILVIEKNCFPFLFFCLNSIFGREKKRIITAKRGGELAKGSVLDRKWNGFTGENAKRAETIIATLTLTALPRPPTLLAAPPPPLLVPCFFHYVKWLVVTHSLSLSRALSFFPVQYSSHIYQPLQGHGLANTNILCEFFSKE